MMRKNREQQKNEIVRQLNLFEDQTKPANYQEGRTGNENCTGVELLSQLKRQHTLTENSLEAVVDYGNLRKAYERVKQAVSKAMGIKWFAQMGLHSLLLRVQR